jgi:hypothetical protein
VKPGTALLSSAAAERAFPASAPRVGRSWGTSHLRRLTRTDLDAVVAVMPAWLHHRAWQPPEGADTGLLWEFIERHGLGGALGALAADDLVPPGEIADLAMDRYLSNAIYYERARRTCRKVCGAAKQAGQPVLGLKGPALAAQAYGGDGGIRAFSDIDLWTVSRSGVFKLLDLLGARVTEDTDLEGPLRRIRAPGAIVASLDGWDIEIRYPTPEPTDPMLELLAGCDLGSHLPDDGWLAAPDPARHLLVLLLHMSWYHYFSRFVWFLDLAALVSRRREEIDFDWLLHESRRLHAANLLAVAARFCRERIDPEFPEFPLARAAWNFGFLSRTASPGVVASGRFSLDQRNFASRSRVLWFRIMRHFLLSDPPARSLPGAPPERWMIATLVWAFRLTARPARFLARCVVSFLVHPAARLTAWISGLPAITTGGEL